MLSVFFPITWKIWSCRLDFLNVQLMWKEQCFSLPDWWWFCFPRLQRHHVRDISGGHLSNGRLPFLPALPQGGFATEHQSQVFDARSMVCCFTNHCDTCSVISSIVFSPDVSFGCAAVVIPHNTRPDSGSCPLCPVCLSTWSCLSVLSPGFNSASNCCLVD